MPFYARRGPNDIAFLESQKRVALEVGTGCTVFMENTAGFEDHQVRALLPQPCAETDLWTGADSAMYAASALAGVEPVAGQPVLPQLRVHQQRPRGEASEACPGASPLPRTQRACL